jgi:CHAT domain-containing protein
LDLNNLAELYSTMGDDAKAVSLLKRSLAIIEKTKGPWHPDVAINLNNLALDLARMGDYQNAHDFNMQAQRIDTKLIEQVMGFTSERQKINFLSTTFGKLYSFISLVRFYLDQSTSAVKDAFDIWIKRKGVILESQRRFQEALIYSEDPGAIQTFQELSKARAALSKLAFMGPGNEKIESYTARIDKLDKKINNLEVQLSQLSERFARQNRMAQADSEELARSLPENSALIEFAKIEMFNFNIREIGKRWDPAHYLVFILNARKANQIQLIDLGNAEAIDRMVNKLRNEISRYKNLKNIKTMTSTGELYKKVFLPIKKKLGDAKEVFVSPDGNLNLIPFEILQGPNGRFLIEDYTFNYLSAARDLLGFGKIGEKGHKALFIGDPDFDLKAKEKSSYLRQLGLEEEKKNTIAQRAKDMRGIYFARLPGTREEVAAICALLGEDKAALYTGKQALEEVLRQKQTPSILHIATHGFFLKDLSYGVSVNEEAIRGIQGIPQSIKSKGARLKITNPLLRSGLALAGANYALRYGDLGFNDGILTAEKILGLKLFGTEMVVLSACETGVGDVKMGEGVYGLRRALTQAGAKSLVMSLWSVPDRETKELMIQFYKNIQSAQMNRCQALRQAVLRQMKIVKDRYGHENPFFWGAFVFLGEP